jgi:hypothetical protein
MSGSGYVIPGCRPELNFAFQIDTTLYRLESLAVHGIQRFSLSFNRTAVMRKRELSVCANSELKASMASERTT